ncbi:MAG: type 4a pilus biogenesis protein PilO [Elusimicrobia bacterium]|nr:type 4a pilus biogenesis protein PilO [Elusimicrobiota bacterium]
MGNRSTLSKSYVKADIKKKFVSTAWSILLSFLFLLLCINKIYRPQKLRLTNTKQKYIEQTKSYGEALNLVKNIPLMENQEKQIDKQLIKLQKVIPSSDYISTFLKQLIKAGGHSGVEIVSIRPGEITKNREYKTFPIDCHIVANYKKLGSFIHYLENNTSFIQIENIEIKGKANFLPKLSIFLRFNAYLFSEENDDIKQK